MYLTSRGSSAHLTPLVEIEWYFRNLHWCHISTAPVETRHAVIVASLVGYAAAGVFDHVYDVLDGELLAPHLAEERRGEP